MSGKSQGSRQNAPLQRPVVLADYTADLLNRMSREASPYKVNDGYDVYVKKVVTPKVPYYGSSEAQSPRTGRSSRSSSPTKKHLHSTRSIESGNKRYDSPRRRVKHNCLACLKNHGPDPCENCEYEEQVELFVEESPPRPNRGYSASPDPKEVRDLIDLINTTIEDLEDQERNSSHYGLRPAKKLSPSMQDSVRRMIDHGHSLIDNYQGNSSRSNRESPILERAADLKGVLFGVKQQLLKALDAANRNQLLNNDKAKIGQDLTMLERRIASNLDKLTNNANRLPPPRYTGNREPVNPRNSSIRTKNRSTEENSASSR